MANAIEEITKFSYELQVIPLREEAIKWARENICKRRCLGRLPAKSSRCPLLREVTEQYITQHLSAN